MPVGGVLVTCQHDHGRSEASAIACARANAWDGFAELLAAEDLPVRPLDVWRFREKGATTHRERLGLITGVDVVLARVRT